MPRLEVLPMRISYRGFHRAVTSRSHPIGLRPSVIPLTIVCGPPAAGKTTYVRAHAGPADLVIDLDEIGVQLSGGGLIHDWNRRYLGDALEERNRYLREIGKLCSWPAAWFIVGAPSDKERKWWKDKLSPKSVILLLPSYDVCCQRIKERGGSREVLQYRAVEEWFLQYQKAY